MIIPYHDDVQRLEHKRKLQLKREEEKKLKEEIKHMEKGTKKKR